MHAHTHADTYTHTHTHKTGELAHCVAIFTSACSAGYTGWVSLCFVWYFLLLHAVRVTLDGEPALCVVLLVWVTPDG